MESHAEIVRRHGVGVFGDGLRRAGVVDAAEQGAEFGELVAVQPFAAAEHHVLQRVRGAGKAGRRIVGAGEIAKFRGDDGGQLVGHDHHAQSVGERGPEYAARLRNRLVDRLVRARCELCEGGGDGQGQACSGGEPTLFDEPGLFHEANPSAVGRMVDGGVPDVQKGCAPRPRRARPGGCFGVQASEPSTTPANGGLSCDSQEPGFLEDRVTAARHGGAADHAGGAERSLQGAAGATQPPPTGPAYVGGQPDAFQRAQRQRAQPDEQTDPTADMQRLLCVEREDPAIGASMGPPPRGSPPCPPHAH